MDDGPGGDANLIHMGLFLLSLLVVVGLIIGTVAVIGEGGGGSGCGCIVGFVMALIGGAAALLLILYLAGS